ncbi:hypothetical protein BgiBS90_005806 [Biomphalaria glabrata]|nr:hypothetical protein BgiBS90_005806 [Biomphalaria glabrata]
MLSSFLFANCCINQTSCFDSSSCTEFPILAKQEVTFYAVSVRESPLNSFHQTYVTGLTKKEICKVNLID